ncbi:phospholipase B1, membrane-associated-like [Triplophysa dalaica]|uniref:phospholipase B1, membrane-associated-like n=1 Tax=Triplophysa dalaica TaxID=1582913 RepID=UPI0024DFD60E|nr:phospholipase B1, membrane-associated-like [Triplophysa dalaica]
MTFLKFATITVLLLCSVKGNWWNEYHKSLKYLSKEELHKKHQEKTRPQGFQHAPFHCPDMTPSPTVPTSVEKVKAADIKVIAAFGDSLTVSFIQTQKTTRGEMHEIDNISIL